MPARPHADGEAAHRFAVRFGQHPQGHPEAAQPLPQGQLDLDRLVTKTYTLDEINEGFEDMRNGKNIRGVLIYD